MLFLSRPQFHPKQIFSIRGLGDDIPDLNPVLDEGSPTSTGGISTVLALCEVLGTQFQAERSKSQYRRGWGNEALNSRPIMCAWTLTVQDLNGRPTDLIFDLTDDQAPLIMGLDLQQFSKRSFIDYRPTMEIKRPNDSSPRSPPIYVRNEDPLNLRAYVDIIGLMPSSVGTLLTTDRSVFPRATTLAKRILRYSHAPHKEMVEISSRAATTIRICLACAKTLSTHILFAPVPDSNYLLERSH